MQYKFGLAISSVIFVFAVSPAFSQNYKIRQSSSMSGMNSQSTIYVKGSRKRTEGGVIMGMGGDVATIEQCDLKRSVKLSEKKKQYFVEPFSTGTVENAPAPAKSTAASAGKETRGGTLTMTSSINDTGERKQMFGLTARHIKTSMKMESSPDACSTMNMQMETDGWYVDLPQFSCPVNRSESTIPYQPPVRSGCQDRMVVKETGSGKLGFPLQVSQTMNNGEMGGFNQTIETLEFSKATLDDSLFEIPADYTLARSAQDLYGRPDISAMMRGAQTDNDMTAPSRNPSFPVNLPPAHAKRAGVKRIGVLMPSNRASENVSMTSLQNYLTERLTSGNVEAVAVSSEADARAAGCDLILTSDLSKLKQSTASKIGGIFGKVTNTDTSGAQNFDVQVDYKLISLADGKSVLQDKAINRSPGDANRAAQSALAIEISAVLAAVK